MANRDTLGSVIIRSDKDTHFTGGLAQHAVEHEDLDLPADLATLEADEFVVESIIIQSDQNLEWDIYLFSNASDSNADIDLDTFKDQTNFTVASGKQIAATAQFYYPTPLVGFRYKITDPKLGKIHVALVNRSATAKNAGATGEFIVEIVLIPVRGI